MDALWVYMGKSANLSEEAYAVLQAQKRDKRESLSQVILRYVPPPIRTFGDLEKHLEALDRGVLERIDFDALERLRQRKHKANRAD